MHLVNWSTEFMKIPDFDEEELNENEDDVCGDDDAETGEDCDEDCEEEDRGPYSRYRPRPPAGGFMPSYGPYGCMPPFTPAKPDITQQLLTALLASQEAHIALLKESHQKELEAQAEQHRAEMRFLAVEVARNPSEWLDDIEEQA